MQHAIAIPAATARTIHAFGHEIRVVMPATPGTGVSAFIGTAAPGDGPPLHVHAREDELFHVLEGRFRIRCGEDTFDLTPGDTALLPRGVPHTYLNTGDAPGRILVVAEPGGFETFFAEVEALDPQMPADMPKVVAIAARHGLEFVGPNPFQTEPALAA